MRVIRKALIFFILVTGGLAHADEGASVRVLIDKDVSSARVQIRGPFEMRQGSQGALRHRGDSLNATVTCTAQGFSFGQIQCAGPVCSVRVRDAELVLNGRRFRTALRFVRTSPGRFSVINDVGMEDYVRGILYHEASHYWPREALKAQAVACRTYAQYQVRARRGHEFDLMRDTSSQVYGGRTSERYRTNQAVDATAGQVLRYENAVFPAYFHATCGGHTEDAARVWQYSVPPLTGVACSWCKDSPHFGWHYVITRSECASQLSAAGMPVGGTVDSITVQGRTDSGRVKACVVGGSRKSITIDAVRFRQILGANNVRSTNFEVSVAGSEIVFEGVGWGHGVGMCQWGAYFMAKQGASYEEILRTYFPGARLSKEAAAP